MKSNSIPYNDYVYELRLLIVSLGHTLDKAVYELDSIPYQLDDLAHIEGHISRETKAADLAHEIRYKNPGLAKLETHLKVDMPRCRTILNVLNTLTNLDELVEARAKELVKEKLTEIDFNSNAIQDL